MSPWITIPLAIAAWLAVVALAHWLARRYLATGPRGEIPLGLLWRGGQLFARLLHRPRYEGLEHRPETNHPGGMIVVSNHTGAVDPVLIQSACRFEIRWLMAENMMIDELDWLWRVLRLIPVARQGADTGPLREAIRHVRSGGVIGIFPEGGIEDPPGQIRPFHEGVGVVVSRTQAPVLLVWVSETPRTTSMLKSLITPSHARVVFIEQIDFGSERDPVRITRCLRQRLAEASGWPLNDQRLTINGLAAGPVQRDAPSDDESHGSASAGRERSPSTPDDS